jgi:UrcA family protein
MKNLTTLVALATFACANINVAHAADPSRCRSETLRYADLDLTTVEGAATLFQRLNGAAARVCYDPRLGNTPDWSQQYSHCTKAAIGGAVAKIDVPTVTAFAAGHGIHPFKEARCN